MRGRSSIPVYVVRMRREFSDHRRATNVSWGFHRDLHPWWWQHLLMVRPLTRLTQINKVVRFHRQTQAPLVQKRVTALHLPIP